MRTTEPLATDLPLYETLPVTSPEPPAQPATRQAKVTQVNPRRQRTLVRIICSPHRNLGRPIESVRPTFAPPPSKLTAVNSLAAVAAGHERDHGRARRIRHEAHRPVGQQPVAATGMETPVVLGVAVIGNDARRKVRR